MPKTRNIITYKPSVRNLKYYFGLGLLGVVLLGYILALSPPAEAKLNTDCTNLRSLDADELTYCLDQSKAEETAYKTQYSNGAEEAALLREELAAIESSLKSFNSLAENERVKQRIMTRMINSFPSR